MNDNKFVNSNRTGLFKNINNQGGFTIPKEIRENQNLTPGDKVEIIPMHEGFYIRKARGVEMVKSGT